MFQWAVIGNAGKLVDPGAMIFRLEYCFHIPAICPVCSGMQTMGIRRNKLRFLQTPAESGNGNDRPGTITRIEE